jgi:hypothetical protein
MAKIEAQYVVDGDIIALGDGEHLVTSVARAGHRVIISLDDRSAMITWGTEEVELVNL